MQVDWPINDMLHYLGPLVTGLHKQTVVISKWSIGQVPLYMTDISCIPVVCGMVGWGMWSEGVGVRR